MTNDNIYVYINRTAGVWRGTVPRHDAFMRIRRVGYS